MRDPSEPIAEELTEVKRKPDKDKLADYRDQTKAEDWVPEPPTY